MAAAAILDFQKFKFLAASTFERPNLHYVLNFIKIGQSVAEIWPIFYFIKMAAVRYLGFINCDFKCSPL